MSVELLKDIIRQGEELASTLSGITDSWSNAAKDVLEQLFGKDSEEYRAFHKRIQSRSRSFDILKQQQEWDNVLGLLSYCSKRGDQGGKSTKKSKPTADSNQKYKTSDSKSSSDEFTLGFTPDTANVTASAPKNTSYRKQKVQQNSQDESNRSGYVGNRDKNQNDQSTNFPPVRASQPSEAPQGFRQQQRPEHSQPTALDPAQQRRPEPQQIQEHERYGQANVPAMNLDQQKPEPIGQPRSETPGQMSPSAYQSQTNQREFGNRTLNHPPESYENPYQTQFNHNNETTQSGFQQDRQPQGTSDGGLSNYPKYEEPNSAPGSNFNPTHNHGAPKHQGIETPPRQEPQGYEHSPATEHQSPYQPTYVGMGESTAAAQLNPINQSMNDNLPTSPQAQPTQVKLVNNQSKIVVITNGDSALESEFTTFLAKLKLQPQSLSSVASTTLQDHNDAALLLVIISDKAPLDSRTAFQWGYFQGCLKGNNILTVKAGNVDPSALPLSSFSMNYDAGGSWKLDLIRALKSQGFEVDANLAF